MNKKFSTSILENLLRGESYLFHPVVLKIAIKISKGFGGGLRELTRQIGEKFPQKTKHHLLKLWKNKLIESRGGKMFLSEKGKNFYKEFLKI